MPASSKLVRLSILVATALVSCSAFAQVNGNTGAYTTSIPFHVPSHRGLEPSLALVYHSSGGNGLVGAGWSLSGFPVVTRQGADGGAPRFDATDTFRLGGRELHPCGASASPGCGAGGTHFAEHETYERITFDDLADQWTVDSRNGTRTTYQPIFTVGTDTYRWGVSSVTDTLGNTVDYAWWSDTGKNAYPDTVTYNGYRVKLYYRDDRSDPFSFATGASLGETRQLLRSVKVELTDGTPIRAYALTYQTPSSSTGRSLLHSVQMYGKNVVIDPVTGVINGGTSLPEDSFTYLADASDHAFTDGTSWGAGCSHARGTGDFNGDGLQDYYCHEEWGGDLDVGLSDGTSFTLTSWGNACGGENDWLSTGELNGDGKTDFLCKGPSSIQVGLSDGAGLTWSQWLGSFCGTGIFTPGDFDGDGRTDLSCIESDQLKVWVSNGVDGFDNAGNWLSDWCKPSGTGLGENWGSDPKRVLPGDFQRGRPDGPSLPGYRGRRERTLGGVLGRRRGLRAPGDVDRCADDLRWHRSAHAR